MFSLSLQTPESDSTPKKPEIVHTDVKPTDSVSLVELLKLVDADSTIEFLSKGLHNRGWMLVDLSDSEFAPISKRIMNQLDEFLKLSDEEKSKHSHSIFGYVPRSDREGFRALTGELVGTLNIPENMREDVVYLSKLMDKWGTLMLNQLFYTYSSTPPLTASGISAHGEHKGYGMLDVVHYYPGKKDERENEVESHADPGVISLNTGSTSPGLQFYDATEDKWYDVPEDKGVIWIGRSGVRSMSGRTTFMEGIHRVALKGDKPRNTIWYEVCAASQVPDAIRLAGFTEETKGAIKGDKEWERRRQDAYMKGLPRTKSMPARLV